jgi:methylase of polypeptide subunit release factors
LNEIDWVCTFPVARIAEAHLDLADLQHHLWQLTLSGKLFTAPVDDKKLHRILDAGTGTGIWAIDIGMSLILSRVSFEN